MLFGTQQLIFELGLQHTESLVPALIASIALNFEQNEGNSSS
jgi:hypothetical protein